MILYWRSTPLFVNNYSQSRESFNACICYASGRKRTLQKKRRNGYACADRDYLSIEVQGKQRFNTEAGGNYRFFRIMSIKENIKNNIISRQIINFITPTIFSRDKLFEVEAHREKSVQSVFMDDGLLNSSGIFFSQLNCPLSQTRIFPRVWYSKALCTMEESRY